MFSKTKFYLALPIFALFCIVLTGAKSTERTQKASPAAAEAPLPTQDLLLEKITPPEQKAPAKTKAPQEIAVITGSNELAKVEAPSPVAPEANSLEGALSQLDMSQLTFKQKIGVKLLKKRLKKEAKVAGTDSPQGSKSQLVALLLCFFIGVLGIHRFYLGYTGAGVIQLLTAGLCGIWTFIDFIRICVGDLQPKNGSYDETLGAGRN